MFRNKTKSNLLACLSLLFSLYFQIGGAQKCNCDNIQRALQEIQDIIDKNNEIIDILTILRPYKFNEFRYLHNQTKHDKGHKANQTKEHEEPTVTYDNCNAALKANKKDNVYKVLIKGKSVKVYCRIHPKTGDGWTTILRRTTDERDFYRLWHAYLHGFGSPHSSFWLGLRHIRQLAKESSKKLWVELTDFNNQTRSAYYQQFSIGNEKNFFPLHVRKYSGDAGDSLSPHNGAPFTTRDKQNNEGHRNCAIKCKGGWWYSGKNCSTSNLNGVWYENGEIPESKNCQGIIWANWKGQHYSYKEVTMSITTNN